MITISLQSRQFHCLDFPMKDTINSISALKLLESKYLWHVYRVIREDESQITGGIRELLEN